MAYRLLTEFERLFAGRIYKHRVSTHGDWVAVHMYEDLFVLGRSKQLKERIRSGTRVIASLNRIQGLRSRRGDGTFGEIVPHEENPFEILGITSAEPGPLRSRSASR